MATSDPPRSCSIPAISPRPGHRLLQPSGITPAAPSLDAGGSSVPSEDGISLGLLSRGAILAYGADAGAAPGPAGGISHPSLAMPPPQSETGSLGSRSENDHD